MSEPKGLNLDVYLDRWIISDGNYDDFLVGETRKFALEFWASSTLTKSIERRTSLQRHRNYSYSISGKVAFATDEVWVLDCGVLAYSERNDKVQDRFAAGDFVQGELTFGVDPFFYFDRLCRIPNIPALIYEWQIHSMAVSREFAGQTRMLPTRQLTVQSSCFTVRTSDRHRVTSCSNVVIWLNIAIALIDARQGVRQIASYCVFF